MGAIIILVRCFIPCLSGWFTVRIRLYSDVQKKKKKKPTNANLRVETYLTVIILYSEICKKAN